MSTLTKPNSAKPKSEPRDGSSSSLASRVKIDPSLKDKKKIISSSRPIMSDTKPRSTTTTVTPKPRSVITTVTPKSENKPRSITSSNVIPKPRSVTTTVTPKSEAKPRPPVNVVKSVASTSKPRPSVNVVKPVASTSKPRPSVNVVKPVASTSAAASLTKGRAKREKKVYSLPGQKFDIPEEREPLRIFYESLSKQVPGSEMAEFWLMEHGMLSVEKAKRAHEKKLRKMKQVRLGTPTKPAPSYSSKLASSQKASISKNNVLDAKKKKKVVDDDDDDDDNFILSHKRRKV